MLLVILIAKKLLEHFTKKNCKKQIEKSWKSNQGNKVCKRQGNKIYVKWKGCDNLFNSWIDKK